MDDGDTCRFYRIIGGWLSHFIFLNCVRSLIKVHKKVLIRLSFSIEKMEKNNNSNVLVVKACHRISFRICTCTIYNVEGIYN